MEALFLLQTLLVALLVLAAYKLLLKNNKTHKSGHKYPPEPPGKWPIIGHLHLLRGKQTLARSLGAIADHLGPIFTIWLGQRRVLVVSSWELAKECLTVHDKALATRPFLAAGKYMGYNYTMFPLAPYGPLWRETRKVATLHLLSSRQLELMKHVRVNELNLTIQDLHNLWVENGERPVKLDLKKWLADMAFNNVVNMVAGKRYYGNDVDEKAAKFKQAFAQFFYLAGIITPSDCIPWLEWFDIGGKVRAMKKTMTEMDMFANEWIEEHRRRKKSGESPTSGSMVEVMLSMEDCLQVLGYDRDSLIKATALALIAGGSDTTYITMTWILTLLLNHRHVLTKTRQELDNIVGCLRNVDDSDIPNLPYLQSIVKETLRLYPAGPLAAPHAAMDDLNIGGFNVPAGTQILFNLWKIQRDPSVWEDPSEFRPERFLTTHKDVDMKGQHFELMPFGSGRRMCPAVTFAVQVIHLTIARLIHRFDLDTVGGEPVDVSEGLGLTMPKTTPLDIVIQPRLATRSISFD